MIRAAGIAAGTLLIAIGLAAQFGGVDLFAAHKGTPQASKTHASSPLHAKSRPSPAARPAAPPAPAPAPVPAADGGDDGGDG